MSLPKTYLPSDLEPALEALWQEQGTYHFDPRSERPVYSIDTPPPTVSGRLHLGHVYSYSHADFMARFFRMNGYNVFYPMGYDDNGLPTDRLVEKTRGVSAQKIGRKAFREECLKVSLEAEQEYLALWRRMGLSVDWRYTYRTIDERAQRIAQLCFLDLHRKGLVYRKAAPAIWCPECGVSIAQADLNDLERESEFVTLAFRKADGEILPIATTRPELLAACVAVFVHPQDGRYGELVGQQVQAPLYGQWVPVLSDPAADPQKGTGAVMCCTFGDQTDVAWWHAHHLALVEAIDHQGRMTAVAGELAGLPLAKARQAIKDRLEAGGLILNRQPTHQTIRVHERCDTAVEYLLAQQWFVRITDYKQELLKAGEQVHWHPAAMLARYQAWVENLNWDWCLSRQRAYGVPFPAWYCLDCGAVMLAGEDELPVDPQETAPARPCACGSTNFTPDTDVLDTWATSSLSPQICGGWLTDPDLYGRVVPFSLRPQAHEIIRTWAFYTITRSIYHFNRIPWSDILISGWALAGEGMGKISKSRGGGPAAPMAMLEKHSADSVRYWAACTSPGKDTLISEEKIQMGSRLAVKLWNVARFAGQFQPPPGQPSGTALSPGDRWILAALQKLIRDATAAFQNYEYAQVRAEIESFFWQTLTDNYLEMAKQRLYDPAHPQHAGAAYSIHRALEGIVKLLAPIMPYVTEAVYRDLYAASDGSPSVHTAQWPRADPSWENPAALQLGEHLIEIATAARRYKSEHNMSLGSELSRLQLTAAPAALKERLEAAAADLASVTRARVVLFLSNDSRPDDEKGRIQIEITR